MLDPTSDSHILINRKVGNILRKSRLKNILVLTFVTASLLTTSFGGAFATSALAAEPAAVQEEKSDTKGIVAGILALGLLSMLGNHGGSDSKSDAAKTTTPTTTSGNTTTTKPTTSTTPTTTTSTGNPTADEQRALQLLNADRAKQGLPALKFNAKLTSLAERYAQDMINRGYFAHNNPEGQTPFDRMNAAGISYKYAGENLAINSSVDTAEVAFMNSPGHRANILSSNYTEVGIGVRYAPNGSVYVVQEFIKP